MDTVARLHRCLVDAIRRERPDRLGQPVTVAQVYQELVPYRGVRAALGVELMADYEDALLRLLAGQGELARLEPEEAREALLRELESPNPDVTAFRNFAACDVWVVVPPADETDQVLTDDASWAPDWVDAAAEALYARGESGGADAASARGHASGTQGQGATATATESATRAEHRAAPPHSEASGAESRPGARTPAGSTPPSDVAAGGPEPEWEPDLPLEDAPEAAPVDADENAAMERELPAPDATQLRQHVCAFCGEEVPAERQVRFCPFCGQDQSRRPCAACGEVLESTWRFCISCGTPAPEPEPSA